MAMEKARDYYDADEGAYGGVSRRYGFFEAFGVKGSGITLGRNSMPFTDKAEVGGHESVHYIQQVSEGTTNFYSQEAQDYFQLGFKRTYATPGTNEWFADEFSGQH
jgi:hypothetical protein